MPRISSRQASIYALLIFMLTLVLGYYQPAYTIPLGGMLLVILLSLFVPGRSSTIISGSVSSLLVIALMVFHRRQFSIAESWTELLFILLLNAFATFIILYIKSLMERMESDQSHMTSLFENATEGIILADHSGTIVLVNPAAERMFGYTSEELLSRKVEILLPKRYRAGHVELRDGFYHHPTNREMGSGRDLFGQRKDGTNFPVEVSLSSYKRMNTRFVIAFVVDITHRKEIEKSIVAQQQQLEKVTADIRQLNTELEAKVEERTIILKEALQRLEQSQEELSAALDKERQLNEIKGRFVSMASHEFRTPLSAVLSSASLLGKYTTTEQQPNREKHIARIKDSVKHLNDLLEDFLSLGKLDEGKVRASLEFLNLSDIVKDTIDELRGLVKDTQHIDYVHTGQEIVFTDKRLVKNILINLVSNAVKFSDAEANIFIRTEVQGDKARISVRDEGMGISEEDQEHLFSSFFRGKNAINIQGTGLGLHIVKRYADLLGGELELESKLGAGTTVTLVIPINERTDDENDPGH